MRSKAIICADCGFIGPARKTTRGSRLLERFIWMVFFIPGPLYFLWRMAGRGTACPKCGSTALVPFDTPEGEAILKRHLDQLK